jgi:hypothetical protein
MAKRYKNRNHPNLTDPDNPLNPSSSHIRPSHKSREKNRHGQGQKQMPKYKKHEKHEKQKKHEKYVKPAQSRKKYPIRPMDETPELHEADHSIEERFDKAFLASLGIFALFSLIIFIPLIGPLMVVTLIPYFACSRGCKFVTKRNGIQVGILVGMIWSLIEIYLLFRFLTLIKISVAEPAIITNLDIFIIFILILSNLIFCVIGGYVGGAEFEKKLKTEPKISATSS